MAVARSLQPVLMRAGAVMTTRAGLPVVASYGSATAELAVCVRNVGLVARSDLSAPAIEAIARSLDPEGWDALRGPAGAVAAIGVVGRRAPALLSALGAYGTCGDPLEPAPLTHATVGGVPVIWIHRSAHEALAIVAPEAAGEVWRAIEQEGRPFGLSCVGIEALERFSLLERVPI
jgi:glycine cleavage system aminomethyltransferase T